MDKIPYGYCHCGCGNKTTIAKQTRPEWGHIKGEPFKWYFNHHRALLKEYKKKHMGFILNGKRSVCWLWLGSVDKTGYPVCSRIGKYHYEVLAHRYMFKKHKGPIPKGQEIDHICNIRNCVRPEHLKAVSPQMNCIMRNKRNPYAACRKLTDKQVRKARRLYAKGRTVRSIAKILGIDESSSSRVCRRKTYSFVK